jgi:glutamate synthase domain-containing protein 2
MGQILKAQRFYVLLGAGLLTLVCLALATVGWFLLAAAIFAGLTLVGIYDVRQTRHAILRNYPILGHMRFIFEGIRPEIRQYLIESDEDEEPFSREQRSIVYQRAKGVEDKRPFGTQERSTTRATPGSPIRSSPATSTATTSAS